MQKFVVPGVVFVFGAVLIVIAVLKSKSMELPANTQEECAALLQKEVAKGLNDGDECAIWVDGLCRKGTYSSKTGECTSKGSVVPLVSGGLGVIAILASIVILVMRLRQ